MYQHLHLSAPLKDLEHVPQPVVSLIESLLDKNPARRPQRPGQTRSVLSKQVSALS
jgi:hypothetical protein